MKFLMAHSLHPDVRHETLQVYSQMTQVNAQADLGKNRTLFGRYHNLDGGTGIAIVETGGAQALAS